ncbi:MAG: hypothetical protein JKX82_13540 [Oleispira sp.]|nr:hypothetical protein [Oleispira sp.]
MKLSLRKQSISIKSLVLTLLLSFIGQAWALPAVCTMSSSKMSSSEVSSTDMLAADMLIEKKSASPCHMMAIEGSAASSETQMDCCDSAVMAESSCSCPDGGCTGSIPFSSQSFTNAYSFNGQGNYYSQSGFPNQINSALFRPPIA